VSRKRRIVGEAVEESIKERTAVGQVRKNAVAAQRVEKGTSRQGKKTGPCDGVTKTTGQGYLEPKYIDAAKTLKNSVSKKTKKLLEKDTGERPFQARSKSTTAGPAGRSRRKNPIANRRPTKSRMQGDNKKSNKKKKKTTQIKSRNTRARSSQNMERKMLAVRNQFGDQNEHNWKEKKQRRETKKKKARLRPEAEGSESQKRKREDWFDTMIRRSPTGQKRKGRKRSLRETASGKKRKKRLSKTLKGEKSVGTAKRRKRAKAPRGKGKRDSEIAGKKGGVKRNPRKGKY